MQEMQLTQVQALGQEDTLEEGMATQSSILAGKIPAGYGPWDHKKSDKTEHTRKM